MHKLVATLLLACCGLSFADTTINGRWLDYYDEGASKRVDSGVMVTTQKSGEKAGAYLKTGWLTWDLKDSTVNFTLKVSHWKDVKILSLLVGNGLNMEVSATIDLDWKVRSKIDDVEVVVSVPFSAWIPEEGKTVDFSKIDSVLLMVASKPGSTKQVSATVTGITVVKNTMPHAVVSLTIDDGFVDALPLATLLRKYGYTATAFVDPLTIDTPGYMTRADLVHLRDLGWGLGGHRIGRMSRLHGAELEQNLRFSWEYLEKFYPSPTTALPFAYPNGETIPSENLTFFTQWFNISGMNNGSAVPTSNINRHSVDKWTTFDQVRTWVDAAVANNEWIIINFHSFKDEPTADEDWSLSDVKLLLDYLKAKSIEVRPI